jgi:TRAP-type C4-dicarboxylate transport system permease small subunit
MSTKRASGPDEDGSTIPGRPSDAPPVGESGTSMVTPAVPPGPIPTRRTGGPVVAALEAVRRVIDRVLVVVCILIFAALVVVVTWQVFSRQLLDSPATWTEETARYVFVILALLAAALMFSERGHIAVEVLIHKFSTRAQVAVGLFVEACVMFFAAFVLVYGGYEVAQNAWGQNISTLPVSVGQVYLILPITGALILFFSICHVVGMFAGTEQPLPDIDEANQGI